MAEVVALGLAVAICGAGVVLALATAFLVLRVDRAQNRRLAAVLVLEALAMVGFGTAAALRLTRLDERWVSPSEWSQDVSVLIISSIVSAYLLFISTLGTPLVRWLRSRVALVALLVYPLALFAVKLSYREDYAAVPSTRDLLTFFGAIGGMIASNVFCLVAAIDAWRRAAAGSVQRDRAKAFTIAFGTRDALLAVVLVTWYTLGFGTDGAASDFAWTWLATVGVPLSFLVYLILLGYGILKTQLFDIDIRLKKGLKATTLTGLFVVAFFVAEQIGQTFISERAGPYVGLAGAGLLALAFVPLRRATERLVDGAMPTVRDADDYIGARKHQVYRAAIEGAVEDGEITRRERAILTRLGADLGLSPHDMAALEDDVARGIASSLP